MNWILMLMLAVAPSQAANKRRLVVPEPPERPVVTYAQDYLHEPAPGSLWSETAARRLMGLDGNARRVGDLITVRITENVATNLDASTETAKKSSASAAIKALLGAERTLRKAHPNLSDEEVISLASEATFSLSLIHI